MPSEEMEMMNLLEDICSTLARGSENKNLPQDMYIIPDKMDSTQVEAMEVDAAHQSLSVRGDGEQKEVKTGGTEMVGKDRVKKNKEKWGSVLVENHPARVPRDGKTVLEKAQERKKRTNLEGSKGMNKNSNPFSVLAINEITNIAECVGVSLGLDQAKVKKSVLDILGKDKTRAQNFIQSCQVCQGFKDSVEEEKETECGVGSGSGEKAPCTPTNQMIDFLMRDLSEEAGQWTCVGQQQQQQPSLLFPSMLG
jgi:hypothetical protein